MDGVIAKFIEAVNGGVYPPHATCLLFERGLLTVTLFGEFFTFLAYMGIPWAMMVVHRRAGQALSPDAKRVVILYASFIWLCGLSHFVGMIDLVLGLYWLYAVFIAVTAVVSCATLAVVLMNAPALYRALLQPSPQGATSAQA